MLALVALYMLFAENKNQEEWARREIKIALTSPVDVVMVLSTLRLCCRSWLLTRRAPSRWHLTYGPSKHSPRAAVLISVSCMFLSLAGSYRNVVGIFVPRSPTMKAVTKEKRHCQRKSDLSETLRCHEYCSCWMVLLLNTPKASHEILYNKSSVDSLPRTGRFP